MQPPSPRSCQILLIEHHSARREQLTKLLSRHGLSVVAVPSGDQALEALKHDRPSIILLDMKLADTNGWELTHRLRAFDRKLPILLLGTTSQRPSGASATTDIQAIVPEDTEPSALLQEVDRWLHPATPTSRATRWPGLILIVDDEPELRHLLQDFLELHGFRVAQAASGSEAVERFKQLSPAVVFLDIKMPGMDGLTTLRQLKAIQPNVTAVMLTGVEEEEAMEEALALGAEDYILKPFNFEYLETILLSKILLGRTP